MEENGPSEVPGSKVVLYIVLIGCCKWLLHCDRISGEGKANVWDSLVTSVHALF